MTQGKHTPGPWAQEHRKGLDCGYRTQVFPADDPDNTIATIHWHCVKTERGFATDREANARLIAAAPDMLDALRLLLQVQDGFPMTGTEATQRAEKSRAAIAKATGETI